VLVIYPLQITWGEFNCRSESLSLFRFSCFIHSTLFKLFFNCSILVETSIIISLYLVSFVNIIFILLSIRLKLRSILKYQMLMQLQQFHSLLSVR
jgi:hypothetical protein